MAQLLASKRIQLFDPLQALSYTNHLRSLPSSSAFWGKVSDKYGRRQALLLSGIYLFVYGILSAMAPNFTWILLLRFLVGFNIGCVPQSVTLFAEFLPTKQRAKCVVLLVRITFTSLKHNCSSAPPFGDFYTQRSCQHPNF